MFQKLDPFVSDLQEASKLLQRAIGKFEGNKKIDTLQVHFTSQEKWLYMVYRHAYQHVFVH